MKRNTVTFTISFLFIIGLVCLFWVISCQKKSNPTTVVPPEDSVSFLVMGDWGKDGIAVQKNVAAQMIKYSKQFNIQFVITTGDNFYPSGVASVSDAHWQASFEKVYPKESMPQTWYPVLGNHDYVTNPEAEIQYSSGNSRWTLPSRYHSLVKAIDTKHSIFLAFTDTSPFVTSYYTNPPTFSDIKLQDTAAQVQWLSSVLTTSTDTWKIVIGHHPVYSVGLHGNTQELIDRFKPVFEQKAVDFYLCGHDHDLEYIKQSNEKVNYLVSGGGSESYPIVSTSGSVFASATPGFMVMSVYPSKASFYFYDQNGAMLYQGQVKK